MYLLPELIKRRGAYDNAFPWQRQVLMTPDFRARRTS